jgi:hypothetical protein
MTPNGRFALRCVLGGLLAVAVADSTYAYLSEVGSYATGQLFDTGWVAAYLGIALGAFRSGAEVVEVADDSRPSPVRSLVVPFLPVLLALGVLTVEVAVGRPRWLLGSGAHRLRRS